MNRLLTLKGMEVQSRRGSVVSRWRFMACLLCAAVAVGALGCDSALGDSFCQAEKIREYEPPLQGMRSVPRPPYGSNGLPLGLKRLEILLVGGKQLAANGGEIGFYLGGYLQHPHRVDWNVMSKLSVVDRRGKPVRVDRVRWQHVATIGDPSKVDLAFAVGPAAKFYRIDIAFFEADGGRVAHYADYFRVMPRRVDTRLALSSTMYKPGEVLRWKLQNLGTTLITFGYEFSLDAWNGAAWAPSEVELPVWPQIGLGLGPGQSEKCEHFALPMDMRPGKYRVIKRFGTSLGGPFSRVVGAAFEVTE
jgi:Bacterial Ig-like domain